MPRNCPHRHDFHTLFSLTRISLWIILNIRVALFRSGSRCNAQISTAQPRLNEFFEPPSGFSVSLIFCERTSDV